MKCHFCGTDIKEDEYRYISMENADVSHTDCLVRHAEAVGEHQAAREIMEENDIVEF